MATDAVVRAWVREQGEEVPQRGKLAPHWHERYDQAHPDQDQEHDQEHDQAVAEQLPAAPAELDTGETPPRNPHRPGLAGRVLKRKAKPAGPRRRVSVESVCANAWGLLALGAAQSGYGPTGRMLSMQAPVAGAILEDAIKGTLLDRLIQPVARTADKGSAIGALLGPPLLVTLLSRRPDLAPRLIPVLRGTLTSWVLTAGPAMKAKERRHAKAMEALGLEEGASLEAELDKMLEVIFGDPGAGPQVVPDAA